MNTFSHLLETLKDFSTSNFHDIQIFTRQYFDNILIPIYSSKREFSLIFCDFNKLNAFNKTYSEPQANIALENSLKVIEKCIAETYPQISFSISRIGGDEFAILIDDSSIDVQTLFGKIKSILQSDCISTCGRNNSTAPKYLDISYGIVNSSEYDNIYDVYSKAQEREAENKLSASILGNNLFEDLKALFDSGVSKFFNNYRISSCFELSPKQSKSLAEHAVQIVSSVMSGNSTYKLDSSKNTSATYPLEPENSSMPLTTNKCLFIHNYMTGKLLEDPIDLGILNMNDLNLLLNNLIRNPVSGFFNKNYLYNFFLNQVQQKNISFKGVSYFDTSGIKDCNTRYGYIETDRRLRKLSNQLYSSFENHCSTSFTNSPFSVDDSQNYIFDLGGGNYLILSSDTVSPNLINKINR